MHQSQFGFCTWWYDVEILKPTHWRTNLSPVYTRVTCCLVTCCPDEQHVVSYVTVDLYPFVSSNRRATNWQQFCCRYTSNMLPTTCCRATCCPGVNAALDLQSIRSTYLFAVCANLSQARKHWAALNVADSNIARKRKELPKVFKGLEKKQSFTTRDWKIKENSRASIACRDAEFLLRLWLLAVSVAFCC